MLEFKQIFGHEGYLAAAPLREEVFMGEQGVGFDYDEYDDSAYHIVGYDKGVLIGAARMYKIDEHTYKIGRVAVKKEYRRGYIGDLMMKTLQDKIVSLGGREAVAASQKTAEKFYAYEGYEPYGEEFYEAGILHIMMRKDLSKPVRHCCGGETL